MRIIEMSKVVWHNARGERVESHAVSAGEARVFRAELLTRGTPSRIRPAFVTG